MIMQFVNLDFIDTEMIQSALNLSTSLPFNSIFEEAGFDSTTFLIEIGPILFIVVGFVIFYLSRELIRYVFRKFDLSGRVVDFIKRKLSKIRYKVIIVRFLLESCLELGLSAMICVLTLDRDKVDESKDERRALADSLKTTGDWASNGSAFLTLFGMLVAPFYLFYAAKLYFNQHEDESIRSRYGKLFKGF